VANGLSESFTASTVEVRESGATSLSTSAVFGSAANRRDKAMPNAPPAPVITITRRAVSSAIKEDSGISI
jgi:hypothetical protein